MGVRLLPLLPLSHTVDTAQRSTSADMAPRTLQRRLQPCQPPSCNGDSATQSNLYPSGPHDLSHSADRPHYGTLYPQGRGICLHLQRLPLRHPHLALLLILLPDQPGSCVLTNAVLPLLLSWFFPPHTHFRCARTDAPTRPTRFFALLANPVLALLAVLVAVQP